MPFVSGLMDRTVTDIDGEYVGKLKDILAVFHGEIRHPVVRAIEVKHAKGNILIPISDVAALFVPAIPLNKKISEVTPYVPEEHALWLVRDVLDKQIIDTNGMRVVRVNDLELTRIGAEIYAMNVDIGSAGLMRRLGVFPLARTLNPTLGNGKPKNSISWDDIELLASDQPMRLRVPGEKLADLHPADLAEIISDLTRAESKGLMESLDLETLAETLEEVEPDFQSSLVEQLPNEKVADLLEEMSPDEAADLLAELPEARSEQLLNLMEKDDAEDVRRLLTYPDDSAGGIMTTEFFSVHAGLTAQQVLEQIRATPDEAETIYYIYVVDEEDHLTGVFSLRNLVHAQPDACVADFMKIRVVSVPLNEEQNEIAKLISKYNLLAIPVIDDKNHLQGIVTADDALDKIIPTAWKKKLPRLYH